MENTKFEFDKLKVTYPADKILDKTNKKSQTGEAFTTEEAIWFWRPTSDLETLNFAGANGWQIKTVVNKETENGEVDIYYLERNSSHPNFGKLTLREEYQKSELYEEHRKKQDNLTKRSE